jgi:hypothetical protein
METKLDCNTIVVGKLDPFNRMVSKVYYSDKEYVIYDIENSDALFHISENVKKDVSEISCEIDEVIRNLPEEKILQYKYRFAKAYRDCFEGNLDNAKNILKSIYESFKKEQENLLNFKYSYIITACIILIINFVISIFVLDFNLKLTETIRDLYYVASFGSLGGLISISITVKSFNIQFFTKIYFYFFDALFRIIVSMASAIAMYYIIKGNIVLGFVNSMNYTSEIVFIFSIMSGFSERYIPKLFAIVEEKTTSNSEYK